MNVRRAIISSIVLLLVLVGCLHAQKSIYWGTARERGLKGPVRLVRMSCTDGNGAKPTTEVFEFTRTGQLHTFSSAQFIIPDCIISTPGSRKVTKRSSQGDVEEASFSIEGDVIQTVRAEYVYDHVGNWTNRITSQMFTYTWEGGPPENSWRVTDTCARDIEYYR